MATQSDCLEHSFYRGCSFPAPGADKTTFARASANPWDHDALTSVAQWIATMAGNLDSVIKDA